MYKLMDVISAYTWVHSFHIQISDLKEMEVYIQALLYYYSKDIT